MLKTTLQTDLTDALKARDADTAGALRMALAAITVAEVAGNVKVELDDAQVIKVLAAEAAKRTESAEIYAAAGRQELADRELIELAVFNRYLPAPIDDDELNVLIAEKVAEAAAAGQTGPRAMGAVIKTVRDAAGPMADGATIAARVKAALA